MVFLLAIESGGYDIVFRSQVGIIVWWTVLLGIAVGFLPLARITRAGWVALGLLAGLALLTAVGALTWTESAERSVTELGRVLTISGVFLLVLFAQQKDGLRLTVFGVGAAVALVAVIALADRFDPGLLPFGSSELLPDDFPQARLNWPLEYWNGLAALMAIGLGPLLWTACAARNPYPRALAAGSVPLVLLATYMTASRGGTAATFMAIASLLILYPQRIRLVICSVLPTAGAALLILLVNRRPEIRDLVPGELASKQGTQMIWFCLVTFASVACLQAVLTAQFDRYATLIPSVSRRFMKRVGGGIAVALVLVLLAGLGSGFIADRWSDFKEPNEAGNVSRLGSVNSSERYFLWDSALEAAASERLTGIGPGAFEFWWAREGDGLQFVRDAHSLYLENLAELGPLGFLLIVALVLGAIGYAILRSSRRLPAEKRAPLAAAAAGMIAFAVAASVDWAWELTVLPVAFFALAAASFGAELTSADSVQPRRASRIEPRQRPSGNDWVLRGAAVAGSLLAIAAIAVPMAGTQAFNSSQALVREGDLDGALADAERSSELQPWAASPKVQQSQVLGLLGRPREAIGLARDAVDAERGNWRNWLTLSQALAETSPVASRRALRRALSLNPRSAFLGSELDRLSQGR